MNEERIPLIVDEGYIYTNGIDVYGSMVWIASGMNAEDFYQITIAEYEKMLANQVEYIYATEEDYQNVLKG